MALPKGKLMALLAVFAAIGIITATGAFTSVQADRTATAEVVGDDSALLGLDPIADYASLDNGVLSIDFTSGNGLNPSATTTFEEIFEIQNNGDTTTNVSVGIDTGSVPSGITVTLLHDGTDVGTSFDEDDLGPGASAGTVGLKFDTDEGLESEFDITIHIEADDSPGADSF